MPTGRKSEDMPRATLKRGVWRNEKKIAGEPAKPMVVKPKKSKADQEERPVRSRLEIEIAMLKKIQKRNELQRENSRPGIEPEVTNLFDPEETTCWAGITNEDPTWEGTPEDPMVQGSDGIDYEWWG